MILRDVLLQKFENYKPEIQEMICIADHLGSLMQYETPGFLPNKRMHRGMWEKHNLYLGIKLECCLLRFCILHLSTVVEHAFC